MKRSPIQPRRSSIRLCVRFTKTSPDRRSRRRRRGFTCGNGRTGKLKSPGTATRYAQVIEDFLTFIGERRAAGNLSTVRPLDIQRFIDARLAKGHAASSAAIVRKVLRIPFNIALRQGLVTRNPALSVEVPEEATMTHEAFTFDQIDAILRIADKEWRTAIMLGGYAGMQLGDAVSHLAKCRPREQDDHLRAGEDESRPATEGTGSPDSPDSVQTPERASPRGSRACGAVHPGFARPPD